MRIWLIKTGEPLPVDSINPRLFRTGMLAEAAAARGHEVTWWSTTVNHAEKKYRYLEDTAVNLGEQYRLHLLHAPMYHRNVSLKRIASHRACAKGFTKWAPREPAPDIIVCALPTIELCVAAVRYALPRGIPVVLDARDMWPDLILDLAPRWTRPVARLALSPMFAQMRYACKHATAIVGVTDAYVDWAVGYAGRPRSDLDRELPMAYKSTPPADSVLQAASRMWREHGIEPGGQELRVCFAGATSRQMDFHTPIAAARQLRAAGRTVRFIFCGAGNRLEECRQLSAGLENVLFPGWVGGAEIWTLMRMSSVGLAPYMAIPNFLKNVPNKPVEYLSAGLPVISSLGSGPLADLLRTHCCGLTYENGKPEGLAALLADLDDHRERLAAMSARALELYRLRYTAEIVFPQMLDHYERIVRERTAGGSA